MNSQTKTLRFEAIPVMDLMGGNVVRAKHGERHAYQPIVSSLCKTHDPVQVAQALLQLYPFASLYIADLDAIQGRGKHLEAVAAIRQAVPHVEIWIDAGIIDIDDCQPWLELGTRCVIGSESQRDTDSAYLLIQQLGKEQAVLSLDYLNRQPRGPVGLFEAVDSWPHRVINMTLGRVGSYEGPDVEMLQQLKDKTQDRKIYAAGGIRGFADIELLASMGITGALVASALHDGKITSGHLACLEK